MTLRFAVMYQRERRVWSVAQHGEPVGMAYQPGDVPAAQRRSYAAPDMRRAPSLGALSPGSGIEPDCAADRPNRFRTVVAYHWPPRAGRVRGRYKA